MSAIHLENLTSCFQGIIPACLFTCSKDGIPNASLLSQIDFVDARHVALSHQFFNKSRKNIAENPQAFIRLIDPDTTRSYELRLRYRRSETSGPLFDGMALRIEAIASHSGMKGVFKLLAADVYEVLSIEESAGELIETFVPPTPRQSVLEGMDAFATLKILQDFADHLQTAPCVEKLLDQALETLEKHFGFDHSMVLLAEEEGSRLVTLASRGYMENGVGSEVRIGEGMIGMVAEARKSIRFAGLSRELLYAHSVFERTRATGEARLGLKIPLPGLPDSQSQLGIPLVAQGQLVGVLAVESERLHAFHERDRVFFELFGSQLALAIQNLILKGNLEEEDPGARPQEPAPSIARSLKPREVSFYASDECVFVDGEYLVRGIAAKILWKLLQENRTSRKTEFTNRELRMDRKLNLPSIKDNLETRLILLRKRLEEKCPEIRIRASGRGRFTLELGCETKLMPQP